MTLCITPVSDWLCMHLHIKLVWLIIIASWRFTCIGVRVGSEDVKVILWGPGGGHRWSDDDNCFNHSTVANHSGHTYTQLILYSNKIIDLQVCSELKCTHNNYYYTGHAGSSSYHHHHLIYIILFIYNHHAITIIRSTKW